MAHRPYAAQRVTQTACPVRHLGIALALAGMTVAFTAHAADRSGDYGRAGAGSGVLKQERRSKSEPKPEGENFFKWAGRTVARDAKTGAKEGKQGYKEAGSGVGKYTKKSAKEATSSGKSSWQRSKAEAKKTF